MNPRYRVLPHLPDDLRFSVDRHTDTHFTPTRFATREEAEARRETLRFNLRMAAGLYPWPEKTPLNVRRELVGEYASGTAITDEGEYRIVVSDLAGNATEISFSIDKTAPIATLGGVDNGGITKGKVTLIEPDEEVNVKVYFNDEEIEYVKGDKFTSAGAYKILVSDIYGNATEYNFEILKSANGAVIALIVIGVIAALGVVAVVVLKKKKLF